jgi:hypothetical protein
MKFLILIYATEQEPETSPGMTELGAKHMALIAELGSTNLGGAGLKSVSTATTVRTVGGKKTVHDGPFAETKEQLGGYYLIAVPDLDAAITVAKKIPLRKDGSVEVRPMLTMGPST